jgi:hypothetical protein
MQESYVITVNLAGNAQTAATELQTAINAVLASTTVNWTCWNVATSLITGTTAFVVFVRSPAPTTGASPYVVPA